MKNSVFLFLVCICYSIAYSQEGIAFDEAMMRNSASRFLKSPEVASMERYGSYPVSEATGIPDITIPIYTIKTGDLEFPISLSYHMGGIRVDDIASCVGLGWTLNAHGSITRTIKGIADEETEGGFLRQSKGSFYDTYNNQQFQAVLPLDASQFIRAKDDENISSYMEQLILGYIDTQSDVYSYQVHSINGSFVYNTNRELIQCPYSDNKIKRNGNDFTIISDEGVTYCFDSSNVEYTYSNDTPYKTSINGFWHDKANSGISSWLISKIISAKSEVMEFEYMDGGTYEEMLDGWVAYDGLFPSSNLNYFSKKGKEYVGKTITRVEKLLSCIRFNGGSVSFTYSTTSRQDKRRHALSEITVRDNSNNIIKKVSFSYDHFISKNVPLPNKKEDYRLKLNSISDVTATTFLRSYSFQYNETVMLPPYFATPADVTRRKYNKGQDHWGFFNGVTTNETLIGMVEPQVRSVLGNDAANREPSEAHMKACILTKITYLTGGHTVFETETNQVVKYGVKKNIGGLRIKSIKSFLPGKIAPETTIEYQYENGEEILGPDYSNYTYIMVNSVASPFHQGEERNANYYTENPISPIGLYMGSPVVYRKVAKLESGGKTVFWFDSPAIRVGASSASSYDSPPIHFAKEPIAWATAKIRKQEIYKKDEAQNFQKIEETNYKYEYQSEQIEIGAYSSKRYNFFNYRNNPVDLTRKHYFYYYWINTGTGYHKLVETKNISYSLPNDSLIQITQYSYGNLQAPLAKRNNLLTEKRVYAHDDIYKTNYYYPQDYNSSIYNLMVGGNILCPVIEKLEYVNNKRVMKTKTEYQMFESGLILPERIRTFDHNDNARDEVIYDKYDSKGNLLQYTTIDGLSTVYLWGYQKQYPIAEFKNATYSQVMTALGEGFINDVSEKSSPISSDWSMINNQRYSSNFIKSHITTYNYKPLVGLSSVTSPSGMIIYYSYDAYGRLKEIFHTQQGRTLIKSYDYHYQSPY